MIQYLTGQGATHLSEIASEPVSPVLLLDVGIVSSRSAGGSRLASDSFQQME